MPADAFAPGGGRPTIQVLPAQMQLMYGYMGLVDQYSRLARDPDSAGVAAVIAAADILKARSNKDAIDYFEKLLPDVKSPTVQRAIRLQLMELYKTSQQSDKALDHLKTLMTTDPAR